MKKVYITFAVLMGFTTAFAQETELDKDTTRLNLGGTTILIIEEEEEFEEGDEGFEQIDEIEEFNEEEEKKSKKSEPHWAGLDFGFNLLAGEGLDNSFTDNPYWRNDIPQSQVWNLNILEHKFNFGTPHVGLTTGLGFNFTSVAFNNNYVINSTADSVFAVIDSTTTYSKNKLKATYLTVPLMLEFNTSADEDKSFYLAAGVVGGVRIASKIKRKGEIEGKRFTQKEKGAYGLNPFKLDAAVRMGYSNFGVFASYSLLPLFETGQTVDIYPLNFGLSLNF